MRVIHLIESFAPSGATTQARLLADACEDVATTVVALRPFGRWHARWRLHDARSIHRRFGFDPFARLAWRRLLREQKPDAVVTSEPTTARFVAASGVAGVRWAHVAREGQLPKARRSPDLLASVGTDDVASIENAAVAAAPAPAFRRDVRAALNVPDTAPLVVAGLRMRDARAAKEIAWAADLLRLVRPGACLVVAGEGPGRMPAERFAAEATEPGVVRFVGPRHDWPALVAAADSVWAPQAGGPHATSVVEAWVAGKPVVYATRSAVNGADEARGGADEGGGDAALTGVRSVAVDDRAGWVRNTLELLDEPLPTPPASVVASHHPRAVARRRYEWLSS